MTDESSSPQDSDTPLVDGRASADPDQLGDPQSGSPSSAQQPDQPRLAAQQERRRYRWWRPRRWVRWLSSWKTFAAQVTAWWYAPWAHEIRAAFYDTRRAPGWVVLGAILVFWPITDFSLIPIGVTAAVWLVMMWATRHVRYWSLRRRIRRFCRPLIGALALLVLTAQAGLWAWLLAAGLWLVAAGVTDTLRARSRLSAWVIESVARTVRSDPAEFDITWAEWDGRRLLNAEVAFGPLVRTEEQAVRDRIGQTIAWSLRHAGRYTVSWSPGTAAFEVKSTPPLPTAIDEQEWGDDLPGIPIGATDEDTADGYIDTVDTATGTVRESLPVTLVDPGQEQRHYLVVGGTGGGKSTWMRGFIARSLRKGWWPGGVYIFDGKSGSDYIVFEGREGIHCVARDPEEWSAWLSRVAEMMRARYEEDAEYERGNRPKPDFARYLVVLDEVQEIRSTLGKAELDPVLQQVSRQIRASNGRLLVSTQRPDAEDAIPGAVKDMLEERIILGFVSATGARMVLDQDWREVVDEYGQETVPGRGTARIRGRLRRIQSFYLRTPREHPEIEHLYPTKVAAPSTAPASVAKPVGSAHWSPKPHDDLAADCDVENAHDAVSAIGEVAEVEPISPSILTPSANRGQSSEPRRRRRTV
jgi:hypothetical protein